MTPPTDDPIGPNGVIEEEFTEARLEAVFTSHFGAAPGRRRMMIGGISVTRRVTRNLSNTGRLKNWDVSFHWIGNDGKQHEAPDPSTRVLSRNNDPDRNWGMRRRE